MPISILGKFAGPSLGELLLDATVSEGHERENETTDSPVEEGVAFTDHIRRKPDVITMEGIVSDTPGLQKDRIEAAGWDTTRDGFGRGKQAFEVLERIFAARLPITVATKLKTYSNMVILRLSIPRNASNGDSLRFSATLKEIRVVKTTRARLQVRTSPENNRVKPVVNGGQQPTKEAPAKTEVSESVAVSLLKKTGLLK